MATRETAQRLRQMQKPSDEFSEWYQQVQEEQQLLATRL